MGDLKITGFCSVKHFRNGELLAWDFGPNVVTVVGKALIAEFMELTPGPARPGWIAFGDGPETADDAQTTLDSETFREAITYTGRSGNEVTYSATRVAIGAELVNECGIFNDAVAGTMLCRFLTQTVNLAIGDSFVVVWTLNFGG